MNTRSFLNPFIEQTCYLAGWLGLCRKNQSYSEELGVEACMEIHAEELAQVDRGRNESHAAEVNLCEGLGRITEAISPDSDGGANITPDELSRIRPVLVGAAVHAHDATEILKIS